MILDYNSFLNLSIKSLVETSILNEKNHPKIPYVSSIKILTNNFKLSKIKDLVEFWEKNIENVELNDINWMYVYCIKYGFMKNLDKKNINIYGDFKWTPRKYNLKRNEADEYLSKLEKMNDNEIEKFINNEPFNIYKNGVIDDGTHRCCSMIGRIIRKEKYINFNINYI